MRNLTVRTTVRSLLEELDKIDPGWYNAEVGGEYRKFGGNIYNTGGANMVQPHTKKPRFCQACDSQLKYIQGSIMPNGAHIKGMYFCDLCVGLRNMKK
jgi:hypothetical protein